MAGRISDSDRERVREANPIERVVGEYVALRSAGGGNLKGLCPFHDEKSASFNVTPGRGRYHCFGCGEGGDVFGFLMAMEHTTFTEAIQTLADRAGITLTLVEGGTSVRADRGTRSRLVAANKAAADFYTAQLATPAAQAARDYLTERGFDDDAATHFGCGFAPGGWDSLVKALTTQGFSLAELEKARLAKPGQRGHIDAFHRRLVWPIRDAAGDVVGFGARRLFDDDRIEAKYLNTADSELYRKSQVLFGLDLAKRDIASQRRAVVVEGYTDVMAMHLAGITTAVASCGTAFGEEHIGVLRRYLADSDVIRGEVIYVFDGDAAGQKAAIKAFDSDQKFAAHTYVCVAPQGMDPCELRMAGGDGALRDLVAAKSPLFAFVIRETLKQFDLSTAEGKVAAATASIPLVARIKEPMLRDEYARQLAGWVGADPQPMVQRVRDAHRQGPRPDQRRTASAAPGADGPRRPDPRDHELMPDRETLKLLLQQPNLLAGQYSSVEAQAFADPVYRAIHEAVVAVGGPAAAGQGGDFVDRVAAQLPVGIYRSVLTELAVERPNTRHEPDVAYAGQILASLELKATEGQLQALRSELRQAEAEGDRIRFLEVSGDLQRLIAYRRELERRMRGDAG